MNKAVIKISKKLKEMDVDHQTKEEMIILPNFYIEEIGQGFPVFIITDDLEDEKCKVTILTGSFCRVNNGKEYETLKIINKLNNENSFVKIILDEKNNSVVVTIDIFDNLMTIEEKCITFLSVMCDQIIKFYPILMKTNWG